MEQDTVTLDKGKAEGGKRDKRLLFSLICFFSACCCFIYEALIIDLYIKAVALGDWDYFSQRFGVDKPYGKDQVCLDFCAPSLPFVWGWIGLANFIAGFLIVLLVWLKPRNVSEMKFEPQSDKRNCERPRSSLGDLADLAGRVSDATGYGALVSLGIGVATSETGVGLGFIPVAGFLGLVSNGAGAVQATAQYFDGNKRGAAAAALGVGVGLAVPKGVSGAINAGRFSGTARMLTTQERLAPEVYGNLAGSAAPIALCN